MKVDIPDKILINRGEDGRLHHSYWTTDQELVPFEDTLYIRKEALMELLLSLEARYSVFYLQGKVIRDVIDKIDSL